MTYTDTWDPSQQTPEAKQALSEWTARKYASGEQFDPHDPEMLMCLDKGDIVSRYLLLLSQSKSREQRDAEWHAAEKRRLIEASERALRWWQYCHSLRRKGRKTAQLGEMEDQ